MNFSQTEVDLAKEYLASFPNLEVPNPRIILIFSGIPGSGKTFIAKQLARDLKANYIRNDDIRMLARKKGIEVDSITISHVSESIMNTVMSRYQNNFFIMDGNLDNNWKRYFEHSDQLHAARIIIRIETPVEIAKKRIIERDGSDSELLASMADYQRKHDIVRDQVKADFTINENTDYQTVLDFVRDKLREIDIS